MAKGHLRRVVRRFAANGGKACKDGAWRIAPSIIYTFVVYYNEEIVMVYSNGKVKVINNKGYDPAKAINIIDTEYIQTA